MNSDNAVPFGARYFDKFQSIDDVLTLLDTQSAYERGQDNAPDTYDNGWSTGRADAMEQIAKILRAIKDRGVDFETPAIPNLIDAFKRALADEGATSEDRWCYVLDAYTHHVFGDGSPKQNGDG
jgi:hypothetical protein